jgi:hypothetical protein
VLVRGGYQEHVRAGIQKGWNSEPVGRLPGALQPRRLIGDLAQGTRFTSTVLDVVADGPCLDGAGNRCTDLVGIGAVAALQIDGDRQIGCGHDPLQIGDGEIERHVLAVVEPVRGRDRPAAGRKGLCAARRNRLGAARIPDVEQDDRASRNVESLERLGLRDLIRHVVYPLEIVAARRRSCSSSHCLRQILPP